jgi:hypothetical protein
VLDGQPHRITKGYSIIKYANDSSVPYRYRSQYSTRRKRKQTVEQTQCLQSRPGGKNSEVATDLNPEGSRGAGTGRE